MFDETQEQTFWSFCSDWTIFVPLNHVAMVFFLKTADKGQQNNIEKLLFRK